jgi:hypothetical protein
MASSIEGFPGGSIEQLLRRFHGSRVKFNETTGRRDWFSLMGVHAAGTGLFGCFPEQTDL